MKETCGLWTHIGLRCVGGSHRDVICVVWVVIQGTGRTSARVSEKSLDFLSVPKNPT